MSSSSSLRNKEPKLSVRNQTRFKILSKNTNLLLREKTILKKAFELSTLCENEVCVIHYDHNGNLVNTWPKDQSKVRDMAGRFSKLSDKEKLKKNTNLSQILNKKLIDEWKRSISDKNEYKIFTEKILGFEGSLKNQLQVLQERVRKLQTTTEPDQSRHDVISKQNHNFPLSPVFFPKQLSFSSSSSSLIEDALMNFCPYDPLPDHQQQQTQSFTNPAFFPKDLSSSYSSLIEDPLMNFCSYDPLPYHQQQQTQSFTNPAFFPKDLSSSYSSLIEDPLMNFCSYDPLPYHQQQHTQSFTNPLMSDDDMSTSTNSLNHQRQCKFSIFVFNHETTTFTQLPDSVFPIFDQTYNLKLQP